MNKNSPDFTEILLKDFPEKKFPEQLKYRIAISDRAYRAIHEHAMENTGIEICGVLIGQVYKDPSGPFLEITGMIRGEHADNQAGQVMFTHETWSYINTIKDDQFAGSQIVGWYHTHPRFGIFLSDQDFFIHKNFFNNPWQIAFVVDPVTQEEGFFIWHNGTMIPVRQFWLEGEEKHIAESFVNVEKTSAGAPGEADKTELRDEKEIRPVKIILGVLFLVVIGCAIFLVLKTNIKTLFTSPSTYLSELFSSPWLPDARDKMITGAVLDSIIKKDKRYTEVRIVQKGAVIHCTGKVSTGELKYLLGAICQSAGNFDYIDLQGVTITHKYTTSKGESLIQIAGFLYGNPERWKDILKANIPKVKDPAKPEPNTILDIPE